MTDKTLIAAKVSKEYHKQAHIACKALETSVAAVIKAAMDRTIKKADKASKS